MHDEALLVLWSKLLVPWPHDHVSFRNTLAALLATPWRNVWCIVCSGIAYAG